MPIPLADIGAILARTPPQLPGLDAELAPSTLPLALLPVRLETRFFALPDGRTELRVRVYPDKVNLDSHDPRLSADEILWGRRFWEVHWSAGPDEARQREAWRMLASRFGPERAAWVARALTPTNPIDRPTAPVAGILTKVPAFPEIGPPATTARTAMVRLLPRRWVATAYAGGTAVAVATGRDIVADLAIGPDLNAPLATGAEGDDAPAVDEGMRWMIDFDRAEEVGMALRIALPASLVTPVIDVLLVVGVRDGDGAAELSGQLDAHRYTDGLAFLPPATPTNNTAAARSAYQAADPQHDASFATEWLSDTITPGSSAALATDAFGAPAFARMAAGDGQDEAEARAMATALWPATWGYFLSQMIGLEGSLTPAGRDWVRAHAIDYLRSAGPLPVLRCGRQPYGVLPVTSLDGWTPLPEDAGATRLREILKNLRDRVWRPAAAGVPRVGRTDNPSADLADVLRSAPLATSFAVRNMMGRHLLQHLRAFLGEDLDATGFWARLVQMTGAEPARLGLGFVPPLANAAYDGNDRPVRVLTVGEPSYIADMLAATDMDALARPVPAEPVPLLHALLRHALLREHAEAAARLLVGEATPLASLLRDPELVDLVPGQPPAQTWSRQRDAEIDGTTVRDRLGAGTDAGLAAMRRALEMLATVDATTLERHLAGTLDATSHRLDAWITSLATRRLAELRRIAPAGVTLGGYGWVENLRPAAPAPAVAPPPDEPGPLVASPDDPGFIHAPSLNQASAAALLRSAHLAHGGTADSPYAIDLSSARLRLAKRLFEGVRQGQPIGALIGYTFERGLHDAGLDEFIDGFRSIAPLPGAATPTGVRRLVVDGLALSQRWQSDPRRILLELGIAETDPRRIKVRRALAALEDAVDAAADAVHAEGAFQMVRGNLARAAAPLDAISSGAAPPPDLGFMATPRTGIAVTHRVAMLFPTEAAPSQEGWADSSPRARADPALAAWAGRLLGPATGIVARVEELGPDGGERATHAVPLSALGLTPIDLVWATTGAEGPTPELVERIRRSATAAPGGPAAGASLRVDLSRAGLGRSLADLVEIAARAQRLLAGARPLHGADLQPPRADPARGLDLAEFEQRIAAAEQAFAEAHSGLKQAINSGDGIDAAMMQAAAFGLPGAVPAAALPGADPAATLVPQAAALLAEMTRRLDRPTSQPAADEEGRLGQLLERVRAVFGDGFLALPRFAALNAAELAASRGDAEALLGDDPLAAYTWLQRMERVRAPLARMARPLREAELLGAAERLDLAVLQVPHLPGRRWIGLQASEDTGAVSLVLQGAPVDLGRPLAGLLVDEWTEVIPSRSETTGIAFQYDPPDAMAPQAILLAVPPVIGQPWRVGGLNRVLLETLDLLRLRLVDPEALGDIRHYLPAAYLAFNVEADAVSTDLNPLAP